MEHACLRSMSKPKMKSMSCSFSKTVIAHGKKCSPTFIGAWCTRPMMFCVPTPFAMPLNRLSMSLSSPHCRAHVTDMIDICAPLSTNAFSATPFTSRSTYSITT